ncbi:MAG: hypothetical protein Q8R70_13120 [Methanoregula sp.]|nr:hypothetical protein [Methanoregula sp.]
MRDVSPVQENEGAGHDVAEGNRTKTHVVVPGIVNVEHITTLPCSSDGWVREEAGTGNPGNPVTNGGAAS